MTRGSSPGGDVVTLVTSLQPKSEQTICSLWNIWAGYGWEDVTNVTNVTKDRGSDAPGLSSSSPLDAFWSSGFSPEPPIAPNPVCGPWLRGRRTAENSHLEARDMANTGRPHNRFPPVTTPMIGGVTVGKHTLTAQAEQLESITGRIGRRLSHWLRTNRDGVPSAEFFEAFRYYQAALLGLLREQRDRARLAAGERESVPTEVLEAQLREEFLRAAHTFTPEEWAMLDRVRTEQARTGKGT
jgi:hypothetical protein